MPLISKLLGLAQCVLIIGCHARKVEPSLPALTELSRVQRLGLHDNQGVRVFNPSEHMNKEQYSHYKLAVASFLRRNHVKDGCQGPKNFQQEPYFSWRPCECCGSPLGGNREDYLFATIESPDAFEASICADCVHYLAYGALDDTTMLEIQNS